MEYKHINIKDVKKADYNPRKISKEEKDKLKQSLKEFGCIRPLVINKRTGNLVSGHQMLDVAAELGWKDLPYIEIDLDEKKEKALNIAVNKLSGSWDYDKLNTILGELNALGDDYFKLSGFEDNELKAIIQMSNVGDLPSDEVVELDELKERFPITFHFESGKERDNIKKMFINNKFGWSKKDEPNTNQLKELLMNKNDLNKNDLNKKENNVQKEVKNNGKN